MAWWFLALLTVLTGGCVTRQHSEFRGIVSLGGSLTNAPLVQKIGGQIGFGDDSIADAVIGFSLSDSEGTILLVYDRRRAEHNHDRISNNAVSGVYFANPVWEIRDDEKWKAFLGQDSAARDHFAGVYRLKGLCDIERWKSNTDFRVHLSMRSAGPDPIMVNGILTMYDRIAFDPGTWCVGAFMIFGVITGVYR